MFFSFFYEDALLAVSKFTRRDTLLRKDMVFQLMMWLPGWNGVVPTPCILRPEPLWSGKQLFSELLPPRMNLRRDAGIAGKNKKDDPDFSLSDCKVPRKYACVLRVSFLFVFSGRTTAEFSLSDDKGAQNK